ncbi:hypothetical protein HYPSUDRAFT_56655 [Hypholoma sublateritium FD-334 SS-4]|uniref:Small RNA 2'-O-methyltransferase n=1 Tax=Hypholoma sublateritium (strain FD-334 SS-4) TaxID=945553 RepID=A0A0D2M7X5_HYPSF|nr:hypothetical protein HYPSUDRAFT_56655 [Hypholoma sublateritium FD-334 SS-4]
MVRMLSKDVFRISQSASNANSTSHHELQTVHFNPRLIVQRISFIVAVLERYKSQTVLDIGSGPGILLVELLRQRVNIPSLNTIIAVEIDEELVQDMVGKLTKDVCIQKHGEPSDICVQLFNASLTVFNPRFQMADAIVATEVIEHLDDNELSSFSTLVFGTYRPSTVILTTPNYDFNKYFDSPVNEEERRTTRFKDPTGRTDRIFRQADHRFEWTMDEFQTWCSRIASTYGYNVEFTGVGSFRSYPTRRDYSNGPDSNPQPPSDPGHFFASQISIFRIVECPISDYTFIL